jgi:hypothetical protein
MPSPLFIKVYTSQHDAMQRDLLFFQLCLEHLGFLVTDHGFEVRCESAGGPEQWVHITFTNISGRVTVAREPFGLPVLSSHPVFAQRLVEQCGVETSAKSFAESYNRVHPLDALGRDQVARQLTDATVSRIRLFGDCLRKNVERI